jgi:hypothetical protein
MFGEFDAVVSVLEKFGWRAHDPPSLGPRNRLTISPDFDSKTQNPSTRPLVPLEN